MTRPATTPSVEDAAEALRNMSVMVAGQVLTSRTETIEDYLRPRVHRLAVIGIASAFQNANVARCSEYVDRAEVRKWALPAVHVRRPDSLAGRLQLVLAFLNYLVSVLRAARRLPGTFDLFVGVSCFSAFMGVILKAMGKVRRVVYYSIDYYPRPRRAGFDRMLVWAFRGIDAFCTLRSDVVWHITPRITEARRDFAGVPADRYQPVDVPLSYRESLLRFLPRRDVERWTIGFVGTVTFTQGLQLLVEAMPRIVKELPEVRVRVVGRGPHAAEVERLVRESGMADRYTFHGFVRDEEEMLGIVARYGVGLATWTQDEDNNIRFADPGKPKLYACLGVPCVITKGPDIAMTIHQGGGGAAIDYDAGELADALVRILRDDDAWWRYRERAYELGREFTSEKILARAMRETVGLIRAGQPRSAPAE